MCGTAIDIVIGFLQQDNESIHKSSVRWLTEFWIDDIVYGLQISSGSKADWTHIHKPGLCTVHRDRILCSPIPSHSSIDTSSISIQYVQYHVPIALLCFLADNQDLVLYQVM
jgi:hypothetical protein